MQDFLRMLVTGLSVGSIYALIALGVNLIFSTKKILNFAQGDLVMLGALTGYTFYVLWHQSIILSFFVAGITSTIAALILERVSVRPFKDTHREVGWVVCVLGFGIILRNAAQLIWGPNPAPYPQYFGTSLYRIGDVAIFPQEFWTAVIAIVVIIGLDLLYNRTIIGKATKAVALDVIASKLVGINATAMIALTFGASGCLSVLAGILISSISFASASMGTLYGIKGFASAVLGGLGSLRGALVGGLIIGLLEIFVSTYIWSGFQSIIAFAAIFIVLIVKPTGIFGTPSIEKV